MQKKRPPEQELLKDLDAFGAHADELGELLPQELDPLERLKGSMKKFEGPRTPLLIQKIGMRGLTEKVFQETSWKTTERSNK